MTLSPKEKAKELVSKYITNQNSWYLENLVDGLRIAHAKQCAIIACEQIIESEPTSPSNVDWDDVGGTHQYYYEAQKEEAFKFWQQVKNEIQLL
jgi:hypothetical protein